MASLHPVGGIRTYLRYVFERADFADMEITLLAPGEDVPPYFAQYIPANRFSVRPISADPIRMVRAVRRTLALGRYDLLHSHGLRTGVAGEIAKTGLSVPHLLTIHDVFLPSMFSGLRGRALQAGLNIVLRRCDVVHVVSDDCGKNFCEFMSYVPTERVRVVSNGIDAERFRGARPVDARSMLGLGEDVRLFGFFGRFMAQKGFRTIVDAVEQIVLRGKHPRFCIVTFGWGGFVREDYEYLRDKGLEDYFIQHPGTDEPERWMKAMDVVLMPSRWEACGLVGMEALAAGVPIIGTNCLGLREVLAGSPAVMVPPGDPSRLAAAMVEFFGDDHKQAFIEYSPSAVDRFDVGRCASGVRALYSELALGEVTA